MLKSPARNASATASPREQQRRRAEQRLPEPVAGAERLAEQQRVDLERLLADRGDEHRARGERRDHRDERRRGDQQPRRDPRSRSREAPVAGGPRGGSGASACVARPVMCRPSVRSSVARGRGLVHDAALVEHQDAVGRARGSRSAPRRRAAPRAPRRARRAAGGAGSRWRPGPRRASGARRGWRPTPRESSRAAISFCWLPPESRPASRRGSGGRTSYSASARARGVLERVPAAATAPRPRRGSRWRPSTRFSASVISGTSPRRSRSLGMCARPAARCSRAPRPETARPPMRMVAARAARAARRATRPARAGRCPRRRRCRRSRPRAPRTRRRAPRAARGRRAPRAPRASIAGAPGARSRRARRAARARGPPSARRCARRVSLGDRAAAHHAARRASRSRGRRAPSPRPACA